MTESAPAAASQVPGPDPAIEEKHATRLRDVFGHWRGRLLDLSLRNRALNYKPSKVGSVTVVDEKPVEVYRQLVGEERTFTFVARDQLPEPLPDEEAEGAATLTLNAEQGEIAMPFTPYEQAELDHKHRDTVLQCSGTAEQLDVRLRRLADLQRSAIEEQGVNTLYLALGFLRYTEDAVSTTVLKAPLVLVPVHLERKSARTGFTLSVGEDEPVLNPSLIEYLRRVRGVKMFPELPELTEDPASTNLLPILDRFQREIAGPHGWTVTEEIALAPFAFQKLVIYKDLEANEKQYRAHPLVRRVALRDGAPATGLPDGIQTMQLDDDYPPERTNLVVDADSSQLRAIAAVAKGNDLVIHGPPGTGKSQTITNLIAEALGQGQRVLFVAEKMAALEVVHERLKQARLAEFCLELHSTKARKGEVLEALRLALHAHGDPSTGFVSRKDAVVRTRGQLNDYVRAVHAPRTALARSAYQGLQGLASAGDVPRIRYVGEPTTVTLEQLAGWEMHLQHLQSVGGPVAPVNENPWRDTNLSSLSTDLAEDIEEARAAALALAENATAGLATLRDTFGVPDAVSLDHADVITRAAAHLAAATGVPEGVLRDAAWKDRPAAVTDLLTKGRQTTSQGTRLRHRYNTDRFGEIALEDIRYVEEKRGGLLGVFAILDGRYRAIRRHWLGLRQEGISPSMLEQAADMKQGLKWLGQVGALNTTDAPREWFGAAWRGAASDWEDLESRATWVEQFHRFQTRVGGFGDAAFRIGSAGQAPSASPVTVAATLVEVNVGLARLRELLHWPADYLADSSLPAITARLAALGRASTRGPAWVAFARAARDLREGPTGAVSAQVFNGSLSPELALRAFRRSFYTAWLDRVIPTVPELERFSSAAHEDIRLTFVQADEGLQREAQAGLTSRLREMGASRYANAPDRQRQFLSAELAKQRRHRPLRTTMREAGAAVSAIAPCFLMSPMSVAQFLGPEQQFDLIIFDEASQLATEDAVGAISRGKKLVVVGDPKQLPPTNFFAVEIGATAPVQVDGEIVYEETESVLEEMQSVGLHSAYLEWHYRSAHQGLIQFSNETFYGNRLVVFPAAEADAPDLGVHFTFVEEGRYEGAGVNPAEAGRVATAVVEHFRTHPDATLGVGTFNLRQQNAIWDALEQYRREDPSLEAFFDRARPEPFFVKNLENIQGDERDVIFLSITYGRQADGRLRLNFGPLNRQEGGRRLNVLVSRARQQMRVFSSMRAADIDPSGTASPGPALMRDFLAFAETGRIQTTAAAAAADADSPFELDVGEELRALGYPVDRQVGVGSYRIDLGVRSPSHPGKYLAGIECDGAAYHSAQCARDRDRLRQMVLERRGWHIVRVWSTDWFKDRSATLLRLKTALEDLEAHIGEVKTRIVERPVPAAPAPVPAPQDRPAAGPRDYVRPVFANYTITSRVRGLGGTITNAMVDDVAEQAYRVVESEGPVHVDLLRGRVATQWAHEKLGSRISAAVDAGIALALRRNRVRVTEDFYTVATPMRVFPRDRSGLGMIAEQVAREEIAAATISVAAAADVIAVENLVKEVREALGLRRSNPGTVRIRETIETLLKSGQLRHSVHGVRAAPPSTF